MNLARINSQIVVWIPVYKSQLELPEYLALWQITQALSRYRCILAGKRKDAGFLSLLASQLGSVSVKLYPDRVFSSVSSYCNLLISPRFYREFSGFKILIAQLDSWICHDGLSLYAEFDYVAPLIYPYPYVGFLADSHSIGVGVGGLSLRSCDSIVHALEMGLDFYTRNYKRMYFKKFSRKGRTYLILRMFLFCMSNFFSPYPSASPGLTALGCNEDWIIGIFCCNRLHVASRSVARRFGVDCYHGEQIQALKPELPFGLHSWWEDHASLAQCKETLIATLKPGWSSFLRLHGFMFGEDQASAVIDSIDSHLQ